MAKRKQCYSGIGGQAVLEGIMMKNGDKCAVAIRKADGTIHVEMVEGKGEKAKILTLPFIRGVINFIESLLLGMKCLNISADMCMDGVEEEPGKLEKWLENRFGDKASDIILTFTMILSVFLAIGLFMVLPYAISALMGIWIRNKVVLSVTEALMRLAIFLSYVLAIRVIPDIKRLYMYHGAEHKCINCIERGWHLDASNIGYSERLHPRCGTSFLLYVMIISCVLFFFINVENPLLRLGLRLLLVPVIASISYEIIRFLGRFDNTVTRILSAPGMLVQKITTKEPSDDMIEVAMKAVEAVFDWKKFLEKEFDYDFSDEKEKEMSWEEALNKMDEEAAKTFQKDKEQAEGSDYDI